MRPQGVLVGPYNEAIVGLCDMDLSLDSLHPNGISHEDSLDVIRHN